MKGPPWHKHYHEDFLNGVHGLGPENIGCYYVVVDMIYNHGGAIPDDPHMIGAWLGCSTRLARALITHLLKLGKLFRTPSGLSNMRAETELAKLRHNQDSAQKSGSKGGRVRAERARKLFDYNGNGQGSLKAASSYTRATLDKLETNLPVQSSTQAQEVSGSAEKQAEIVTAVPTLPGKDETIVISPWLQASKLTKRRAS